MSSFYKDKKLNKNALAYENLTPNISNAITDDAIKKAVANGSLPSANVTTPTSVDLYKSANSTKSKGNTSSNKGVQLVNDVSAIKNPLAYENLNPYIPGVSDESENPLNYENLNLETDKNLLAYENLNPYIETTKTVPTPANPNQIPPTITNVGEGGTVPEKTEETKPVNPVQPVIPTSGVKEGGTVPGKEESKTEDNYTPNNTSNASNNTSNASNNTSNASNNTSNDVTNEATSNAYDMSAMTQTYLDAFNEINKKLENFKYSKQDKWDSLMDQLLSGQTPYSDYTQKYLDAINNREAFNYDANTDALYQNYLAQMQNQGARAMKDTMGQASALTGGYGSSYATAAANGAYNNYLQEANANLDNYYNMALNKYNTETDNLYNQLSANYNMDSDYLTRLYEQANLLNSDMQNEYSKLYDSITAETNALNNNYSNAQWLAEYLNKLDQQDISNALEERNMQLKENSYLDDKEQQKINNALNEREMQLNENKFAYTQKQDDLSRQDTLNSQLGYAIDGKTPLATSSDSSINSNQLASFTTSVADMYNTYGEEAMYSQLDVWYENGLIDDNTYRAIAKQVTETYSGPKTITRLKIGNGKDAFEVDGVKYSLDDLKSMFNLSDDEVQALKDIKKDKTYNLKGR